MVVAGTSVGVGVGVTVMVVAMSVAVVGPGSWVASMVEVMVTVVGSMVRCGGRAGAGAGAQGARATIPPTTPVATGDSHVPVTTRVSVVVRAAGVTHWVSVGCAGFPCATVTDVTVVYTESTAAKSVKSFIGSNGRSGWMERRCDDLTN